MSGFSGPLYVEYIDGEHWIVEQGFTYAFVFRGAECLVTIPRGFITDFASMPLGVLFRSPGGKWDKPAIVHDVLYRQGVVNGIPITRKDADDIFKDAMSVAGVSWWQRQTIWFGVRVGGWATWDRYRLDEAA